MTAPTDAFLRDLLIRAKTFACIGLSPDPLRPSHFVGRYLSRRGYRVIGVNPGHAGKVLFGEAVIAGLPDVPCPIDVLDVFRRSEAVPGIVTEALALPRPPGCVWLQVGVRNAAAAEMCAAAGVAFVEDRCPKIEHQRLFGELRKAGFATGIISSRL